MTWAARSSGLVSLSSPLCARPTGVLMAVVMTASRMTLPGGTRPRCRGRRAGRSLRPSGARPGPDDDGSVLQERDLGTAAVRLVVTRGLGDGPTDAELRAEDALRPDHGLLVAAGAGVGQAAQRPDDDDVVVGEDLRDRKSTRLNSSHVKISYAV